jgi:hypothetical protein
VREPVTGSAADRRQVLAEVVAMKLRLGYELVSEDEFAALSYALEVPADGCGCERAVRILV